MAQSRKEKLLDGLDTSKLVGVEIGALANPFVRREDGEVIYVDYTDRDALVAKYSKDPHVITENIVHVDAIWGANTLDDAVKGHKVDYVVASHVIEHVPDLITWLTEIRSILKPTGSVRLIIPDRRFTFDILRQETRLSDLLASYVVRARMPQPYFLIDHAMNITPVDIQAAWEGRVDTAKSAGKDAAESAINLARNAIKTQAYHDVHCWVFTPKIFCRLMRSIAEIGLLDFACDRFYDTERGYFDFFVSLKPSTDLMHIVESWKRAEMDAQDHHVEIDPAITALEHQVEKLELELRESARINALLLKDAKKTEAEAITAAHTWALARDRIVALEQSTSWRITRLPRSVATLIKRINKA